MKITITRKAGGHAAGDTIETSDGAGQHLIDAGYGEKAKANAKLTSTSTDADAAADAEQSDSDEPATNARAKRS